jgi:hypothetical protein
VVFIEQNLVQAMNLEGRDYELKHGAEQQTLHFPSDSAQARIHPREEIVDVLRG